ncbi:PQQ-dependent sugar dehydrogenase [Sulfitobacter sp. TSTF-M16]|uniref:PQQ-dependent sugar dehydrogenase n=2 Tax=Sulfitobacter aestuariivivens TaxID=2766981 RepID=A0A927HED2_9RHOB|nr:PQQ-dependent sugar dehydrogenase [Sulfitobacter aestuariivivens]MBD3663263.1 PQQ-dependent sugar dehydrogenase [Sulfitobacter aestuariivivens]
MKNFSIVIAVTLLSVSSFSGAAAQQSAQIEGVVQGLDTPWAIAPLPRGGVLITEKDGRLLLADGQNLREVAGTPNSDLNGQGGLLDITLARDFDRTRTLFLTYAKKQPRGAGTAMARARLSDDGTRLEDLQELFAMKPGSSGGRHFGSRVVEAPDGTLFVTIGDRGDRPSAQDRSVHNGSIVRINRDGTVPRDNPFVGQSDILPEIWSYGHRNPQGAGLDLDGTLWTSEHGARGGDEVNKIIKGANYGWPVISYGRHYSGGKIGEGTAKEGMQQPMHYWDPSIAPSGLLVYSGKMFPDWRGHIFVGALKFDYIARLAGLPLKEVDQIKGPQTARVRDIVEGPDGAIWFISVGNGTVYRIIAR